MNKSKKILVLLSILLVAVLIYLGVLVATQILDKDETQENESTIEVLKLDKENIKKITIESREGTKYEYKNVNDVWNLTSKHDFRVKSYIGILIATTLDETLMAKDIADQNPTDISEYGLDNPTSVTTVYLKDGSERKITVGDISPSNDVYYVTVDQDSKVYMITRADIAAFVGTEELMWNNYIYSFEKSDIKTFTLYEKNKKVYKLISKDEGMSWQAEYPIKTYVNYDNWETVLTSMLSMLASELVDKNPKDLAVYGLENPRYTIEIESSYGTIKVDIGDDETKGKYTYAKIRGYDEVFILSSSYIAFANLDVTDILSKGIYSTSIDEVSQIDIKVGSERLNFKIDYDRSREESENIFELNGKKITEEEDEVYTIQNFFVNIILIEMDGVDLDAKVTSGNYDMTISFTDKETKKVVTFGYKKKNSDSYYVFKNDKYMGITASSSTIQTVVADMASYM